MSRRKKYMKKALFVLIFILALSALTAAAYADGGTTAEGVSGGVS